MGDQDEDRFQLKYPDDLDNIIFYIRNIKKAAKNPTGGAVGSTNTGFNQKGSSFSSFSSFGKGSSFGQKKAQE